MGRHHVRILSRMDGVRLVGVADARGDRFNSLGSAPVPVYPDLAGLLQHDLDFCVVAVPTANHERAAIALAERGVATLIEKPLASDVHSGLRIVKAFAKAGVVAGVGYVERYNAALRQLRQKLAEGALGEIFQVVTRRQGPLPDRINDVGVVKDLASHDLDLTAWITGARYDRVAAQVAYRAGRESEDLVAIVGNLDSGAVVSHLVNWLSPAKERKVIVTGERGSLEADTLTADLTMWRNGKFPAQWDALSTFRGVSEGDMIRFAFPKPEPLVVELTAFRDAVQGNTSDIVTLQQGLECLAVAESVLSAAASGQVTDVQLAVTALR